MMTKKELHVDFSFKKNKTLFLITGIEVEKKKYDPKHKFIFFFNIFWLFFDGAGSVFKFIEQIMSGNEFEHIAYTSPIMVLCSLSMFKSISVLYYRDIAHSLYSLLQNLEIEEQKQDTTLEKENVIKEERSFLHRVINVINFVFIALSVAFAVHPVSTSIYTYYKRNEVILLLPFQIKYPFDAYNIKYWPAIYLHQLWSEVVVIWNLVIVDHLFFTFCTYIRIQFRLLQHDLERLINYEELSRDNFAMKFRELIQRHIKLIQASDMLEAIYTKSILCNFLSSSVMICLTGFDLVMISNKTLIIIFISFLAASLLQVFFLCFFADLLMVSSTEVGDALYNSKWYLKDSTVGKSFLIVLIRSQRACKLTAYTFVDLNLRAFMRVVSNAWSYFALLQTIYS